MRTARLEILRASVATTRCRSPRLPQMNKFWQVSSNDKVWGSLIWWPGGGLYN